MNRSIYNSREKNKRSGFTLIELLIVISIIGILAAITLAFLNNAKIQGNDSAVKSNLSSLRTQMELYYTKNGNYGNPYGATRCPTSPTYTDAIFSTKVPPPSSNTGDPIVYSALQQAIKNGEPDTINNTWNTNDICLSSGAPMASKWVVAITMKGNTKSWCVDYTGASKLYQTPASSAVNFVAVKCN